MKPFLLFRDRELVRQDGLDSCQRELIKDLELKRLLEAMAGGDSLVFEVSRDILLSNCTDVDTIQFRQQVLRDCLSHSARVREIYALAGEAIAREKRDFWTFSRGHPSWILSRSVGVLGMFVEVLGHLRLLVEECGSGFESDGFRRFFAMLSEELADGYFAILREHLEELAFPDGVLVSARLGKGNKGAEYVLRRSRERRRGWLDRLLPRKPAGFTFHLHPRDESGHRELGELKDEAINLAANAVARSSEHILNFFRGLRGELAFYLGCVNLHERLAELGAPVCLPHVASSGDRVHSFEGLYDVCLALTVRGPVVGNDLAADSRDLVIITGANQGGKSTFLRSVGLAQLMLQSGMFVPAHAFRANVCDGVFTHFKREEDPTMTSGKLDEELKRMNAVVERLVPSAMVLFNESFSATNEREGSEIGRQIVTALVERGVKVFFVTHLYEFARAFDNAGSRRTAFLRAERQPDGTRTFKLLEGRPLPTSFGRDIYEKVFANRG